MELLERMISTLKGDVQKLTSQENDAMMVVEVSNMPN
jgi:hypothetical protein